MSFLSASVSFVLAENICMTLLLSEALEGSGLGTFRPNSVKGFPYDRDRAIRIFFTAAVSIKY
jgi:hypothetical protein